MTTQKERECEDARRLASFDEQDDGADDWHMDVDGDAHGCARRWGPLFGLVLARALMDAFEPKPGTPLFEFLRRRIGVERTES